MIMIRGRTAVLLATAALALAGLAAPAAAATHHARSASYLMDFQGTVTSPAAGNPYPGEALNQMTSGAWQITFNASDGLLCLKSAPTWCIANNGGIPKMRPISVPIHTDWVWEERVQASGGIHFRSAVGGYLCATGGNGSPDMVSATLSACPGGPDGLKWFFNGTTARR